MGVGEIVRFTGSAAGDWTQSVGTAVGPTNGATFRWRAPAVGGAATVTLTTGTGSASLALTVVAPNNLTMVRATSHALTAGSAGTCMLTNVTVHPLDVNLGATQWLEVPGPA
ncbi:MAG: hypothetical protein VKO21_07790, partial [Candidatus Sericytochromatia bacterium]|nr:hypothetical protein [Candidatus Sericytochromatia bacterium]